MIGTGYVGLVSGACFAGTGSVEDRVCSFTSAAFLVTAYAVAHPGRRHFLR